MRIALPATIAPHAPGPGAAVTAMDGETMGTQWRVRLVLPPGCDPAGVRTAIVDRLASLVREMSHWSAQSLLCRYNASPPGSWTALPPDFAHVMARGLHIAALTDGAFDPAMGRLVDLWGFGPHPIAALPGEAAVAAAHARSGWRRLAFAPPWLHQPGGVSLDLSGIAKGHAVDAIADLLATHGIDHALVEIGGELVGRGIRPDREPWWVDLEPPPDTDLPPLRIALHGLAVATSGDYRRGAHTLDPRTGRPTTNGVVSASVIARTALAADAWATALTVLGPVEGMAHATRHAIAARIVTATQHDVREYLSPALTAMLADD